MKKILTIILFIVLGFTYYFFRHEILNSLKIINNQIIKAPCSEPITYKISKFSEDFKITEFDFLKAINEAEELWESKTKLNLFEFSTSGEMSFNLVYDNRQKATTQLIDIKTEINSTKQDYLDIKRNYDYKKENYQKNSKDLDSLISKYNSEANQYEQEVKKWNKNGGAPSEIYEKLQTTKNNLDKALNDIKEKEEKLKIEITDLNNKGNQLNSIAKELNIDVETHNEIGQQFESEFEQGNYRTDINLREINIYQFDNYDKLVTVLAHEMGHALGLDHIKNEKALMYYKSIGQNVIITQDDLDALNNVCSKNNTILIRLKTFLDQ